MLAGAFRSGMLCRESSAYAGMVTDTWQSLRMIVETDFYHVRIFG